MKLLGRYKNGNYDVFIFDDGTKIRQNKLKFFKPEKPESMDIKITNCCDKGCPFCHEASTPEGKHGDILNLPFLDTLLPYTELAIGGGNPLTHPDLIPFLEKCKKLNLIANITVNQFHFIKHQDLIKKLVDEKLIYGLGISLTDANDEFIKLVQQYPNAVIHVINGVHSLEQLKKLYDKNLKMLILGYKEFRKGLTYFNDGVKKVKEETYKELPDLVKHFKVVSFDNLALTQLKASRLISEKEWRRYFLGDDGIYTMYVDCVERKFSKSSTTPVEQRKDLLPDIKDMFIQVH